ncbi:DNA polymerase [Aureibacillus halotolerans]|uniref:DNA-directed DNA polymerase n=1 Tax=Aureibacillus halotolerans TaxID=1508390 RepID=A0A4R6U444_9BACI|nr:DNA polymerase [Aureibacillus halotolerans]TDQ39205.1 DNA polymerase [Aureibacillus halotolerans]
MTTLSIDIETYCELNLKDVGVYRYAEHESFEILMIAYAYDENTVQIMDLHDEDSIDDAEMLFSDLIDPTITKTAHNANFERTCLANFFGKPMPPEQWRCTMVDCTRLGLPAALGKVAEVLKLDEQKDTAGTALINYFAKPCKASKANGQRTRNLPEHDPEKWQQFLDYCVQDVETERAIRNKVTSFPVLPFEQELWALDQEINDVGVRVDMSFMQGAVVCDAESKKQSMHEAELLTGLDNPNSPTQLLGWLIEQGADMPNLKADTVEVFLESYKQGPIHEALKLRQELSKTSVKKYSKMQDMVCDDGRVRGLLQFYGASKTGRWAGRGVQVQNLTKNEMSLARIGEARSIMRSQDFDSLDLIFNESKQNILSQLVRTSFIPRPGCKFVVSDFSAIEARVIAWFANETWRLEVFNTHGKIYEASASAMFKVPIEQIVKGSDLRQRGKVAELALGYQGGPGALIQMGALDEGMEESELKPLVNAWRAANPNIVKFWYACDAAALSAVRDNQVAQTHGLTFRKERGFLFIDLPSGRSLAYAKPHVVENKFGREAVAHFGLDDKNRWTRIDAYGGKWVENIVQATARDVLAESMIKLHKAGYRTVMHVHDEVVEEVEKSDTDALDKIVEIMSEPLDWAEGLPLAADAFETEFYMKD